MYWLSSLLIVASLVLVSKAVQTKKNVELLKSQIVSRQQPAPSGNPAIATVLSDADLVGARQIIEGLAARHKLPISVKLDRGIITIVPEILDKNSDIRAQDPEYPDELTSTGNNKKSDSEDESLDLVAIAKVDILQNYEGLMAFLGSLSSLPFPLVYKSLCIGLDCTTGFEVILESNKQV